MLLKDANFGPNRTTITDNEDLHASLWPEMTARLKAFPQFGLLLICS
jgi:hypothetical protein